MWKSKKDSEEWIFKVKKDEEGNTLYEKDDEGNPTDTPEYELDDDGNQIQETDASGNPMFVQVDMTFTEVLKQSC